MANEVALMQITGGQYLPHNTMSRAGRRLGELVGLGQASAWYPGDYTLSGAGAAAIIGWRSSAPGKVLAGTWPVPGGHPTSTIYKTEQSPVKAHIIRFIYKGTKLFGVDKSLVEQLIAEKKLTRWVKPVVEVKPVEEGPSAWDWFFGTSEETQPTTAPTSTAPLVAKPTGTILIPSAAPAVVTAPVAKKVSPLLIGGGLLGLGLVAWLALR